MTADQRSLPLENRGRLAGIHRLRRPILCLGLGLLALSTSIGRSSAQPADQRSADAGRNKPRLSWVPAEGISHPALAAAGPTEAIEAHLSFGSPADVRLSLGAMMLGPFRPWRRAQLAASDGRAVIERQLAARALTVTIHGVEQPAAAIHKLIQAYRASSLPLTEVFLVARKVAAGGVVTTALADPRVPELGDYPDPQSLWRAAMDPARAPPPSENPSGMSAVMVFPDDGQVFYETRGTPLYFPEARIVYGNPSVEVVPADARGRQVADVLRRSFNQSFPARTAPAFFNGDREEYHVSRVRHGERIGYSFAIDRAPEVVGLFAVRYPQAFRFREYELMAGLVSAIERLALEPVIFWDRGPLYVVSLWERVR